MISLIVATIGRVAELDRLFCSLDRQTCRDFEVIVVDQNPDDRLLGVIRRHPAISVKHLRSERGLSKARNVGLRCASGNLIAIPDDDCWYPEHLLANVKAWFGANASYGVLSTCIRSEDGLSIGPNWPKAPCDCDRSNIFRSIISCSMFFRREIYDSIGEFDEALGVGSRTKLQSGEETDYALRALDQGFRQRFEPSLVVYHPPLASLDRLRRATFSYAVGSGYLLRAHNFSPFLVASQLVRSCGGILLNLLHGRARQAWVYALRAAGQLAGYFSSPQLLRTRS
jgi:glycosyltransferase involved in cell wall biosynthesis